MDVIKTIKKLSKLVAIVLSVLVLLILGFYFYLTTPSHIYTEISPDGKYTLAIYEEPMFFAMPGGGSDNFATLILRHSNGELIGKVNSNSGSCAVLLRDVEIVWSDEWVYYVRSVAINFKTGECG